ncbi:MAG: hypothetical protein WA144_08330 [Candidatus Methanoperedens sp.]
MSIKILFTILSVMILSFQITNAGTIDQTPTGDTLIPGGTYIITSGSTSTNTYTPELSPEVAIWDTDNSGTISKAEAVAAVRAYLTGGGISKADAVAVVRAYLTG